MTKRTTEGQPDEPIPAVPVLPPLSPGPPLPPPPLTLAYATAALVPYASAEPRARMLIRWSWAAAAAQLLAVWAAVRALIQRLALARGQEPSGDNYVVYSLEAAIELLVGVISLVVLILWLMWVHRTYRNLPALGAQGLRFSPGWAMAYYFIPILSFFRPFQVMRETWRASDPLHEGGTSWRTVPAASLINWWWGISLGSVFVSLISVGFELNEDSAKALVIASSVNLFVVFVDLALLLVQIRLVRRLTQRQEERAGAVGTVPTQWPVRTGPPVA